MERFFWKVYYATQQQKNDIKKVAISQGYPSVSDFIRSLTMEAVRKFKFNKEK